MGLPLLIILALGVGPGVPASEPHKNLTASPLAPARPGLDEDLAALAHWSRKGPQFDPQEVLKCERLLEDVDRAWVHGAPRSDEIQRQLLDFLGRCQRIERQVALRLSPRTPSAGPGTRGEPDLRRRAAAIIGRRLPDSRRFLTLEVLLGREDGEPHPLERRLAACEVLAKDKSPDTVLALLSCTRPAPAEDAVPPTMLDAAVAALAGRGETAVHLRLVDLLRRADAGQLELWGHGVEAHFGAVEIPAEDRRGVEKVHGYVVEALAHEDWRRASRGVALARCLPHDPAFPTLVEGLADWVARGEDPERQTARIQGEILAELERRSARKLGPKPERWRAFWQARQRGEVTLSGEGPREHLTVGGFFGLRPRTDRVTFVLDRSGSMAAAYGSQADHTRLDEAAAQMAGLLGLLGERTRFDVVVFSDGARSWRRRLERATEENVSLAARWVRSGGAKGGTHLRDGIHAALHVDRRGELDLEALEADTVVVLCDGETAEGPHWVEPFLRDVNDAARVVFHAVQIGGTGDGSLERLCASTGGQFLRVDG